MRDYRNLLIACDHSQEAALAKHGHYRERALEAGGCKQPITSLKYSANDLLTLREQVYHRSQLNRLPSNVTETIKLLRVHKRRKRGKRYTHKRISSNCDNRNLISINRDKFPSYPIPKKLKYGLINARSVRQKSRHTDKASEIAELIVDNSIDILCITETWIKDNNIDSQLLSELAPPGFKVYSQPRCNKRGGGLAVVYRETLKLSVSSTAQHDSFECLKFLISIGSSTVSTYVVYRPPNPRFYNKFLEEFTDLIGEFQTSPGVPLVVGDFNVHVDNPLDTNVSKFLSLLEGANLKQHVHCSTHQRGHTLDLVISNADFQVESLTTDMSIQSDHWALLFGVNLPKPAKSMKSITTRKWKELNTKSFAADIRASLAGRDLTVPDSMVDIYNGELLSVLNNHCPKVERNIILRPNTTWYTPEMSAAKRECRKLENQYKRTNLMVHFELYKEKRNDAHSLREQAKIQYYNQKIEGSQNQKDLFRLINSLSGSSTTSLLPQSDDTPALVDRFADYFVTKIDNIRNIVEEHRHPPQVHSVATPHVLSNFITVTEADVLKHLSHMKPKSCCLDPIPTWLLKDCKDTLVPALTTIINTSLSSGVFPSQLKDAVIRPVLKKPSLDVNDLKNYRPVSNLPFLAKFIEREVSKQFIAHLDTNNTDNRFQSAYRAHCSTETALARVQNDLLQAVDREGGAMLILLDLSAAFDTIDHRLLLEMLMNRMGVHGVAWNWFQSYLKHRNQRVSINGVSSGDRLLKYGVPQGSVLGPVLFTSYTQSLHDILDDIDFHCYADDTQLYLAFNPRSSDSTSTAVSKIECCFLKVKAWMSSYFLKLNDAKTEVLIITPPNLSSHLQSVNFQLGESSVSPGKHVRDLGVTWDSSMNFEKHVTNICKCAYFQLHNIYRIRKYLTVNATKSLVHAFITSRLDYCNGLLYGIPNYLIDRLQRIQNAAARLITGTPRSSHITPVLRELHWLPVPQRIRFKLALLTFKAINGLSPTYLSELLTEYSPSRTLRSASNHLLVVPPYKLKRYGGRAFFQVAPTIWNSLPDDMRNMTCLNSFKKRLKTLLFNETFTN